MPSEVHQDHKNVPPEFKYIITSLP